MTPQTVLDSMHQLTQRNVRSCGQAVFVLVTLSLTLASGCGRSGPTRYPVQGDVTLNGGPLANGTIVFVALRSGAASGYGTIEQGVIRVPGTQGPTAGLFRVEITSYRDTGRKGPGLSNELEQVVPPRYNLKSELTAEISPAKENRFRFDLTSP